MSGGSEAKVDGRSLQFASVRFCVTLGDGHFHLPRSRVISILAWDVCVWVCI